MEKGLIKAFLHNKKKLDKNLLFISNIFSKLKNKFPNQSSQMNNILNKLNKFLTLNNELYNEFITLTKGNNNVSENKLSSIQEKYNNIINLWLYKDNLRTEIISFTDNLLNFIFESMKSDFSNKFKEVNKIIDDTNSNYIDKTALKSFINEFNTKFINSFEEKVKDKNIYINNSLDSKIEEVSLDNFLKKSIVIFGEYDKFINEVFTFFNKVKFILESEKFNKITSELINRNYVESSFNIKSKLTLFIEKEFLIFDKLDSLNIPIIKINFVDFFNQYFQGKLSQLYSKNLDDLYDKLFNFEKNLNNNLRKLQKVLEKNFDTLKGVIVDTNFLSYILSEVTKDNAVKEIILNFFREILNLSKKDDIKIYLYNDKNREILNNYISILLKVANKLTEAIEYNNYREKIYSSEILKKYLLITYNSNNNERLNNLPSDNISFYEFVKICEKETGKNFLNSLIKNEKQLNDIEDIEKNPIFGKLNIYFSKIELKIFNGVTVKNLNEIINDYKKVLEKLFRILSTIQEETKNFDSSYKNKLIENIVISFMNLVESSKNPDVLKVISTFLEEYEKLLKELKELLLIISQLETEFSKIGILTKDLKEQFFDEIKTSLSKLKEENKYSITEVEKKVKELKQILNEFHNIKNKDKKDGDKVKEVVNKLVYSDFFNNKSYKDLLVNLKNLEVEIRDFNRDKFILDSERTLMANVLELIDRIRSINDYELYKYKPVSNFFTDSLFKPYKKKLEDLLNKIEKNWKLINNLQGSSLFNLLMKEYGNSWKELNLNDSVSPFELFSKEDANLEESLNLLEKIFKMRLNILDKIYTNIK